MAATTNKYTLTQQLGSGTFGNVFRAFINGDATKPVAVKRVILWEPEPLDAEGTYDTPPKEYFAKEVQIHLWLRAHQATAHIAQLEDWFLTQDTPASDTTDAECPIYLNLVFPLFGVSMSTAIRHLAQHLRQPNRKVKPLIASHPTMRLWIRDLLRGVADLHAARVAHRDLKPANLLVKGGAQPALKICDLGSAAIMTAGKRTPHVTTMLYRAYGHCHVCVGPLTHGYTRPELFFGSVSYDTAVDMWAVGCVIAELFTTTYTFGMPRGDAEHTMHVLAQLGSPTAEDLRGMDVMPEAMEVFSVMPHFEPRPWEAILPPNLVPEDIADLVAKLLRWNPSQRLTAKQALLHPAMQ